MKKEATRDTRKPPLGLQPRWSHEGCRLMEILDAIERYVTAGLEYSPDWTDELRSLAESPHVGVIDLQKAQSKISEIWGLLVMMDQEWPKAFEIIRARLMSHRGAQVCPKCRGEGQTCISCLRPVDVPGCEDMAGALSHPQKQNCLGCLGRGLVVHE